MHHHPANHTQGANLPLVPHVQYIPGAGWDGPSGRQRGQGPPTVTHIAPRGMHLSTTQQGPVWGECTATPPTTSMEPSSRCFHMYTDEIEEDSDSEGETEEDEDDSVYSDENGSEDEIQDQDNVV